MSTTPAPVTPPTKLQTILQIIQFALTGLSAIPVIGPDAVLASAFLAIFQNAQALYQAESGQPFDVTKIPLESKV
jgi:hypothetical protein